MARFILVLTFLVPGFCGYTQEVKQFTSIHNAVADTSSFVVPDITTVQLKQILATGEALLLDTRPHEEWASGHIPGALNVSSRPGVPMSLYTSDVHEILRLTGGDKNKALVLYCNGPYCDKSKRVSTDLIKEGFTNVVRYQGGTPLWRTTGNVMELEKEGLIYFSNDKTAVWVDAREESIYRKETIQGAINIPFSSLTGVKNTGMIKQTKDDGRLPMHDHNTRIVVIAANIQEAAAVAEAITKEAFHNVSYFKGSFQEARDIMEGKMLRKKE